MEPKFKTVEITIMTVIVFLIICGVYWIIKYNRFHRLVNNVEESSSGIDVALAKRFDLINNLMASVKGYTKYEQELLKELSEIRSNLEDNRELAIDQMDETSNRLFAISEAYPEIKANDQFLNLQKNLTDVEEHLQAARRLYNRNVTELNIQVSQFPTSIIAKNMGVKKADLFAAKSKQKSATTIDFKKND